MCSVPRCLGMKYVTSAAECMEAPVVKQAYQIAATANHNHDVLSVLAVALLDTLVDCVTVFDT